eukprot:scaffold15301_cov142-Cylindrotheca_fusiformis.AAC.5
MVVVFLVSLSRSRLRRYASLNKTFIRCLQLLFEQNDDITASTIVPTNFFARSKNTCHSLLYCMGDTVMERDISHVSLRHHYFATTCTARPKPNDCDYSMTFRSAPDVQLV